MDETLIIERLGPIKKLEIKPRPLTIIIGEQASGKSLVAQVLYFFRGVKTHLARVYKPELSSRPSWHNPAIKNILDSLRGVPFANFANGVASLRYRNHRTQADWGVKVDGRKLSVKVLKKMTEEMDSWACGWQRQPEGWGQDTSSNAVFIPTERGLITRLLDSQPSALFAPFQPMSLREFAEWLMLFSKMRKRPEFNIDSFILECQRNALAGEAVVTPNRPEKWLWKTDSKILPISAASSGQMEAWPFFEFAAFLQHSGMPTEVYFEEPETHVHPRAQVEIMKVVAYLVNRGHNFVITTHSPFLLQVVDNMLQRFMKYRGQMPEGEERWLDPEKVAAYCLRRDSDQSPEDIMDREDTGLLDATELEKVANELGAEFDELLYGAE